MYLCYIRWRAFCDKNITELGLRLSSSPEVYAGYKNKLKSLLKANISDYPDTDHKGNPMANIGLVTVEDFFNRSRNMLVQENLMQKYCIGDPLLLVPNLNCEKQVLIITRQGRILGFLPDEGEFTDSVRKRLDESYDVFAQILKYELLHNGRLTCEIRIVYYVTPFDKGIRS